MPRTGTFGGFDFDHEVFTDYMAEQPTWKNAIIQSGILVEDNSIAQAIGNKGNVGTMPFYTPLDIEDNTPLNNDGLTNNTPTEISGNKQTFMAIQRMKAWKAKDFTKELTGADPMTHIANSVTNYYQQVWQKTLTDILYTVMSLTSMKSHIADLTSADSTVTPENQINAEALIYLKQSANGDKMQDGNLLIMHSMILAKLTALKLVEYDKYTVPNALSTTSAPRIASIGNDIIICDDRGTVDTSGTIPVYKTYIAGTGSFLTANKNLENPYVAEYDPETSAGVDKLYTKQSKIIHPNGFSFKADNVATESPTDAELTKATNWELKMNHKNIRLGLLKTNG